MLISQTPLRISFVGGGTDLREYYSIKPGKVISSAINKYIYVIVKKRFDDLIVLHYTENEICHEIGEIKHELIREALKKVSITKGIEITTLADIPSKGSGLGSSSTVTVGLLNALYNYLGKSVSAEKLAKEACDIEINILKKPIGKQDQYIVAYGGLKKLIFNSDETVDVKEYVLEEQDFLKFGSNIILHYTNMTRSADAILSKQKKNTNSKRKELDKIAELVDILDKNLNDGNFDILGELLKMNWEYKKSLAEGIANLSIEHMVTKAHGNGALGCKIAGAGGGGFLLSYVPRNFQNKFRKGMKDYRELPFMLNLFGSRIIFNIN